MRQRITVPALRANGIARICVNYQCRSIIGADRRWSLVSHDDQADGGECEAGDQDWDDESGQLVVRRLADAQAAGCGVVKS